MRRRSSKVAVRKVVIGCLLTRIDVYCYVSRREIPKRLLLYRNVTLGEIATWIRV